MFLHIKAEETALAERRKAKENRADSLKEYLSSALQSAGKTKIDTARNAITFRRSFALQIPNEEAFKAAHPELCVSITTVSIPKKEITDRIKSGQEVSGAELVEKQNIQIK